MRRRALFLTSFFLLPLPLAVFDGRVPPARDAELAFLCALVGWSEGAGGPVKMMFFLFAAHALVYGILCWSGAWLLDRFLRPLPRRPVGVLIATVLVACVLAALLWQPYATPFGRAPRGNLWEALT